MNVPFLKVPPGDSPYVAPALPGTPARFRQCSNNTADADASAPIATASPPATVEASVRKLGAQSRLHSASADTWAHPQKRRDPSYVLTTDLYEKR